MKIKIISGESIFKSKDFLEHVGDSLRWKANMCVLHLHAAPQTLRHSQRVASFRRHLRPDAALQAVVKESHLLKWRAKRDYATVHVETSGFGENMTISKEGTYEPAESILLIITILSHRQM